MGNVCTRRARRKNKYTKNEKNIINKFLSKDLYENELKFKMPTEEVESITDGVKTIVKQLMTAVGDKEPLLEISHQYLVGSMAEGTSIVEPNEFDYLVVLNHFSEPGAISIQTEDKYRYSYTVCNENIDLSLRKSDYVCFYENRGLVFEKCFMSNILKVIISSQHEPLHVETDQGKLTLNSTTVCHHGPASVVKLLWKPKSESSTPLDILIDITPCIEQNGIDKIKNSKYIPDGYKSFYDTFMLIPIFSEMHKSTVFKAAITTTEVKIVNTLSSHHKTSYMILKYCFNSIKHWAGYGPFSYHPIFSSYLLKMLVLQHVVRCQSPEKGHHDTEECLFTCLLDTMGDLKKNFSETCEDAIFGTVSIHRTRDLVDFSPQVIDNVIGRLVHIGKKGYSEVRHEEFRKACHRTFTHHSIQYRADELARDNVECHLSISCNIHTKYDVV